MTGSCHGAGPARVLAAIGLCALFGMAQAVDAATLRILPVRIEMAADKQFCSLTISNDDATPATVQIRGFGWRKDANGVDQLDPVDGPVVNPSIVSIPGRASRLVRCSLPAHTGPREESYRLIIDELPTATTVPGTVRALLRISMPIFRAPPGAAPALRWSAAKVADGGWMLSLFNQGDRHVQVTGVTLRAAAGGDVVARVDRGFYLLAGGRIDLPVQPPGGRAVTTVQVETAQGPLTARPAASGQ